jgi:hypothetical protein
VKKGQTSIALVILGIIAIIALIGLILLVKKTPSGALYGGDILISGPLNWANVLGFAPNFEAAESWCPYHKITDGGFLDAVQLEGDGNYRCFAIPPESVPEMYQSYAYRRPIACFAEGTLVIPPHIQAQLPLICNPPEGIYNPFPYQ